MSDMGKTPQLGKTIRNPETLVARLREMSRRNRDEFPGISELFDEAADALEPISGDTLREKFADALQDDTFTCGRVWEAWQYGTMTQDDFAPAWESDEVLDNLIDVVRSSTPHMIDQ